MITYHLVWCSRQQAHLKGHHNTRNSKTQTFENNISAIGWLFQEISRSIVDVCPKVYLDGVKYENVSLMLTIRTDIFWTAITLLTKSKMATGEDEGEHAPRFGRGQRLLKTIDVTTDILWFSESALLSLVKRHTNGETSGLDPVLCYRCYFILPSTPSNKR